MNEQGFTIVDNDLFDDKFISGQEKWLLVVLIRYWNSEKGCAYPSYKTLMEKADMSKATLRKHLVSLELKKYIEIIQHRGKTVENNNYKINKYLCLEIKLSDSEEKSMFGGNQSLEIKPSQGLKTKLDRVQKLNKTNTIYTNTNNNICASGDIEKLWNLYPNKKGKAIAIKKIPKLIKDHSYEQLERCIIRYSKEVEGKKQQYIKHGSTFFNTGYMDYLDKNYIEPKEKETVQTPRYKDFGSAY